MSVSLRDSERVSSPCFPKRNHLVCLNLETISCQNLAYDLVQVLPHRYYEEGVSKVFLLDRTMVVVIET